LFNDDHKKNCAVARREKLDSRIVELYIDSITLFLIDIILQFKSRGSVARSRLMQHIICLLEMDKKVLV
jgi:hypothetical protein